MSKPAAEVANWRVHGKGSLQEPSPGRAYRGMSSDGRVAGMTWTMRGIDGRELAIAASFSQIGIRNCLRFGPTFRGNSSTQPRRVAAFKRICELLGNIGRDSVGTFGALQSHSRALFALCSKFERKAAC